MRKPDLLRDFQLHTSCLFCRHTVGFCDLGLDLPGEYEPTEKYSATLGHKVNHKFVPNSAYTTFDSARYNKH